MFHILGFLFVIIVVILVIGLSIIGTVLRTVFGLGKRRSSSGTYQNGGGSYQSGRGYSFSGDQQQDASSQSNGETTSPGNDIHRKHKKLFSKDEGEYVDFEQIKIQSNFSHAGQYIITFQIILFHVNGYFCPTSCY